MIERAEIISRLTIYDIYGDGIKKVGNSFKMLCPLPGHKETKPSFVINQTTKNFHCFGCNTSGSPIDFVMIRDGTSFFDACKSLAEKAGIELKPGNSWYPRLFEITELVQQYYHRALSKNQKALDYLKERGLNAESIEKFKLGCTDSTSIVKMLKEKGYTDDEIYDAGVASKSKDTLSDLFYKRIIFPLTKSGKVRGFGGRTVTGSEPKYLNSPTTPIFQKKEILYGLDSAMSSIKEKGFALLVEGNFDVIMCHQKGYDNTVAPLGTALSAEHVELLKKYTDTVIPIFDGDTPGIKASERAADLLFQMKMKGAVAVMPQGEDPASYLQNKGSLDSVIESAIPYAVYLSKRFPYRRKSIFTSLLQRSTLETSEFLSFIGTKEEIKTFMEINSRSLLEHFLKRSPLVLRIQGIEVRKEKGYLVFFSKGRFLFWKKADDDYKKQAETITKSLLKIKKKAKHIRFKKS